ncbi:TonB-linked outer membrane protein, SusC/RagA family [Porphyromonadaceae bacterium NLAE-zl-C104]|nr:TonB-linked outer membrane protein, SusC/RagA family [Porphyromonadaceae bacterium NLAE-zl-C104]
MEEIIKSKQFASKKCNRSLRIMKMSIFLFFLCILGLAAENVYPQQKEISLNLRNVTIKNAISEIEKSSDYLFLITDDAQAELSKRTSIRVSNESIQAILETILKDANLGYKVVERQVSLYKIDSSTPKTDQTAQIDEPRQQRKRITGTIKDSEGYAIIGANIIESGTVNGTVTDMDGHFVLDVEPDAMISVSYIGYLTQEIPTAGRTLLEITLLEDTQALEELVVVGYGVQKKRLITGATVQVDGDNLTRLSTTSALGALQSQAPGVNITQSSGMPGEGFKVHIRGIGTIGNSTPLYVIDGVAGGDINLLNPSDIASIDVLKDAASAAIYGARAANGVILVTTKRAKAGKTELTYDGWMGWQNVYRMPSLLNAKEYMAIINESRFNEGTPLIDFAKEIPNQYQLIMDGSWNGTNWLDEARNENAITQNHAFGLLGGSEMSKFSMGFSYSEQDGIIGKPVEPHFNRYTARINSEHVLLKVKDFDAITIGENLTYSYNTKSGIGIGNIYWNDVHNLLVGNPLMPILNSDGGYYDQSSKVRDEWNLQGAASNPLAEMVYRRGQNLSKNHMLFANVFAEIQPIKNLKYRSSFGYRMSAYTYRQYTPTYELSTTLTNATDDVSQSAGSGYNYTFENTLSYLWNIDDVHAFDAVIGQSIEKWGFGEGVEGQNSNSLFPGSWKHAWLHNTQGITANETSVGGEPWGKGALASFFGRLNYNYKEKYLATIILRTDGSSNFARGHRWGYFPSLSGGWVISNEPFMENSHSWMDFLKLRASWGQNGNSSIDPFQYLATISFDKKNGYYFGNNKADLVTGGYADILPNPDVTWETSEQLNIGVDARFANSRLGVTFDWYNKTTKDWLVVAPILASYGTNPPYINGGDIRNRGVELGLDWNDRVGDFTYGANFNIAYNKNEVIRIANAEGIIHGAENVLSQGTKEMYRAEVGYPIGYFWGFKTAGVFQNAEQVASTQAKLENAQPGDLIFMDTNGDGAITDADKVMIGDPNPDFQAGLSINFGYKGFDLSLTAVGKFGHQIAKSYRSFADSPLQNYTTEIFERWHGEGTSNRLPKLTSGSHPNWQNISDIYIENGDYVKLQNLTVGYDLKKVFHKLPFTQTRIYFTAQNLYTFTKYSGMDPEVGYGDQQGWVSGIDLGFYPSPRTYLIGVNLKF